MRLACQEHLLPGATLAGKWDAARRLGFDGIELRGEGGFALRDRLPELRTARRNGAVFPTVCVIMDHFIGDFDAGRRRDALENMKSLLSVIAELGGTGAITPASYGMHSNVLPPFRAPRSPDEDREVLLDMLAQLGDHAASEGVSVLLEPLNRYEDHMLNTLAQGAGLCRELAHPSVRLMADLFHMSIEERDPCVALADAFEHLAHIHVADSNRLEPGQGHADFAAILATLRRLGYAGYLAFECRLSGEPMAALRDGVDLLGVRRPMKDAS